MPPVGPVVPVAPVLGWEVPPSSFWMICAAPLCAAEPVPAVAGAVGVELEPACAGAVVDGLPGALAWRRPAWREARAIAGLGLYFGPEP